MCSNFNNTENKDSILNIENLSIQFDFKNLFSKTRSVPAVENLNLSINKGEFVALVGESGCGKSLTALSIMKLLPKAAHISNGKIIFCNKNITTLSKKDFRSISGNEISIIFQDPMSSLNPLKKAGIQIAEAAIAHGKDKKTAEKKAMEMLKLTGFKDPQNIYNSYPSELSGGMKQRILIAMALINEPKLLIADEPTTALDVTIQAEIIELLFKLNKKLGTAVLLISHDLTVVANICSKIYVMYSGEIIENSSTEELLTNPLHPYTKALIQTIPDLEKRLSKLTVLSGNVPSLEERSSLNCRFYDRCELRKTVNISEKCRHQKLQLEEYDKEHFVRCCSYCMKSNDKTLSSGGNF
ncbi:MAG: ABC transporter ATP-binding protein [Treponema sp.]|nr:ABC transporter ATP-binding protein [Candidatus Treponema merdequi]